MFFQNKNYEPYFSVKLLEVTRCWEWNRAFRKSRKIQDFGKRRELRKSKIGRLVASIEGEVAL